MELELHILTILVCNLEPLE